MRQETGRHGPHAGRIFCGKKVGELEKEFKERMRQARRTVACAAFLAACSLQEAAAKSSGGDTVWSRFSDIMKDIYGEIVGLSTIVGVTAASVALIVRMVSRNQKSVDEATSWLKRIIVTWIVLNSLGFIVAYLQPLIAGGAYTG